MDTERKPFHESIVDQLQAEADDPGSDTLRVLCEIIQSTVIPRNHDQIELKLDRAFKRVMMRESDSDFFYQVQESYKQAIASLWEQRREEAKPVDTDVIPAGSH
jgi:hypothetical protein